MKLTLKNEGPIAEIKNMLDMPTGSWRHKRPVIKANKCSQCGWCYLYCPTGSVIEERDQFSIDLNFCKGCGVCANICPVSAIMLITEEV
jgi:pyruvate ferredoxin oxidoreductase delta subunit